MKNQGFSALISVLAFISAQPLNVSNTDILSKLSYCVRQLSDILSKLSYCVRQNSSACIECLPLILSCQEACANRLYRSCDPHTKLFCKTPDSQILVYGSHPSIPTLDIIFRAEVKPSAPSMTIQGFK